MEDNKDKELQPKKRGRKPKVENKVDENQTMDFMNMMTPEMMQMFMKFMESQQKTEVMATAVEEEKHIKWNKSMLNKIKDEMGDVLWQYTLVACLYGLSFEDIIAENVSTANFSCTENTARALTFRLRTVRIAIYL